MKWPTPGILSGFRNMVSKIEFLWKTKSDSILNVYNMAQPDTSLSESFLLKIVSTIYIYLCF